MFAVQCHSAMLLTFEVFRDVGFIFWILCDHHAFLFSIQPSSSCGKPYRFLLTPSYLLPDLIHVSCVFNLKCCFVFFSPALVLEVLLEKHSLFFQFDEIWQQLHVNVPPHLVRAYFIIATRVECIQSSISLHRSELSHVHRWVTCLEQGCLLLCCREISQLILDFKDNLGLVQFASDVLPEAL